MVTLHVECQGLNGETQHYRMSIRASAQLSKIEEAIIQRIGRHGAKDLRLSWHRSDGAFLKLSQTTWREYVLSMWLTQPWVVHAHEAHQGAGDSAAIELQLDHTAKILFERYDINRNGVIERPELSRAPAHSHQMCQCGLDRWACGSTLRSPVVAGMLRDARLERFDCSPALVERYVQAEFDRLDVDGSGYIELPEFTQYITRMTPWMRAEIMVCLASRHDAKGNRGQPVTAAPASNRGLEQSYRRLPSIRRLPAHSPTDCPLVVDCPLFVDCTTEVIADRVRRKSSTKAQASTMRPNERSRASSLQPCCPTTTG
eukprot:7015449-Prymnesium_polylepis.1